jgi:hypothetical protein
MVDLALASQDTEPDIQATINGDQIKKRWLVHK